MLTLCIRVFEASKCALFANLVVVDKRTHTHLTGREIILFGALPFHKSVKSDLCGNARSLRYRFVHY